MLYNLFYPNKNYVCDNFAATNESDLATQLETFYKASTKPKLLEIFTPAGENAEVLKNYFLNLK